MTSPPVLQSSLLAALPGVRHAFFTRKGGVSAGLYDSLNVGRGSRDRPAAVEENRRRAAGLFGAEPDRLVTAYQVHSAEVMVLGLDRLPEPPRGADGVVTTRRGVICGALAADCAPVLIADAAAGVVAAVHAGWRGALAGVVETAVAAMTRLGGVPVRMTAAIGPCIAQASYEVGLEFLARFETEAPGSEGFFAPGATPDKRRFDLAGFVLSRLEAAGVGSREWIGRDTCGEPDDFFSSRRATRAGQEDYGRLLSAIVVEA